MNQFVCFILYILSVFVVYMVNWEYGLIIISEFQFGFNIVKIRMVLYFRSFCEIFLFLNIYCLYIYVDIYIYK